MSGDDPRPAAERRAAAYHEAGHAVVSWRQGDGIGGVTIDPAVDPETGERNGGHFVLLKGRDRTMTGWGHRHLVMVLSGPAAQHAHDPRSCVLSCATFDLRIARDYAFVMSTSPAAARALLLWAQAEARARVAADWPLIEVLADALLAETTLTGDAATALLEEVDRAHRRAAAAMRAALADAAAL